MADDWKRFLQPASLGGVRFHVDSREYETGRRHHNHEYPKRDENFAEDMGRKTRRWNVSAYLVGSDYASRRDQLIKVGEREGPHSYVDRFGISHQVVVDDLQVKEVEKEGRFCTVSLKLIAAGSKPSGMGIASALAQIGGLVGQIGGAGLIDFAQNYLPGQMVDVDAIAAAAGVNAGGGLDLINHFGGLAKIGGGTMSVDGLSFVPTGDVKTIVGLDGLPHKMIGIAQ